MRPDWLRLAGGNLSMELSNTLFFGLVIVLVVLFVAGLIRMVRKSPRKKSPYHGSAAAMGGAAFMGRSDGFGGDGSSGGGGDGGGGCG